MILLRRDEAYCDNRLEFLLQQLIFFPVQKKKALLTPKVVVSGLSVDFSRYMRALSNTEL